MKYIELFNYLINKEELNIAQAIRTIFRVRVIDPEIKKEIGLYLKSGSSNYTVVGVNFSDLRTVAKMKPIRAFLMLDWLKREPNVALHYLARLNTMTDLSEIGSAKVITELEENDKSDIIL